MKKNGVVHFEIYARDAEKLAKFYSSLFDWTIEAMPGMDYHYVKTVDTDAQGHADAARQHQRRARRAPGGL